jgi:predicted DNA-binding protein (MmcQ/YjbR family)
MTKKRDAMLERVRAICAALPETAEQVFGGHTTPTFRVREKIYVMYHEPADGQPANFWCKAPLGAQQVMVSAEPERFFAPPYVGPKGWIGMHLREPVDWDLVGELMRDSYRMTAPKRLLATLDGAPPAARKRPSRR